MAHLYRPRLIFTVIATLASLPLFSGTPARGASFSDTGVAASGADDLEYQGNGEHYTAHGQHALPPGYREAPSPDFQHGPDPDQAGNTVRDKVTGANLTKFGSAYGESSPVSSGTLGDSTGNGWVSPRGNQ